VLVASKLRAACFRSSASSLESVTRLPQSVLILVQVLVGFSLGARLERGDLARLPRAVHAGIGCGLAPIAAMAFVVWLLLSAITSLDPVTLKLGSAPGGLSEMIASAKAFGAAFVIVAGFPFVRSFPTTMIGPQIIIRFEAGPASKGPDNAHS